MFGRIVGAAVGVMLGAAVSPGPRVGAAVGATVSTHLPSTRHVPVVHTHLNNQHVELAVQSPFDPQKTSVSVLH